MNRSLRLSAALVLGPLAAGSDPVVRGAEAEQTPPYVQTAVVEPGGDRGAILGICVRSGGGLVGVTGVNERYGAGPRRNEQGKPLVHRVVWFDAGGAEARAVDLDFAATVVAAAPEGGVYVAGDGVVTLMSAEGEEVARGTTPQVVTSDEERAAFEKALLEKREAALDAYDRQIERLRTTATELEEQVKKEEQAAAEAEDKQVEDEDAEADPADEKSAEEERRRRQARLRSRRQQASRIAAQVRQMEAQAESIRQQAPALLVEQALRKTRQVRAISACSDGVFLVVGETSGYGFAVWRLDGRLGNPEQVLSKLVGCCGQMDVQVVGGQLAIAANRKHCVELCGFDGKTVATVGAKAAAGDDGAGFGGCCNPMNSCQSPDGSLLTSESNGVVKRFGADGTFVGIVGTAGVRGGCKNSAIAIEPDGSRLYYLDSVGGKVLVLTKNEDRGDADEDGDATREE